MTIVKYHDQYVWDKFSRVYIWCPLRKVGVQVFMPSEVSIRAKSNWESPFGNLNSAPILSGIEGISQFVDAQSIFNQPWLLRKVWKGSEPLSVTLNLIFYTTGSDTGNVSGSAKKEVYNQVINLLSFCLPIKTGSFGWVIPGPNPRFGLTDSINKFSAGVASKFSVKSPINLPDFKEDSPEAGAWVSFSVGRYMYKKFCYLTEVEGKFSSLLSSDGYPMRATATATLVSMDVLYTTENPLIDSDKAEGIQNQVEQIYGIEAPQGEALTNNFALVA